MRHKSAPLICLFILSILHGQHDPCAQTPVQNPHYVELHVSGERFRAGDIVPLQWTVHPELWGDTAVNVYIGKIYGPSFSDRPATLGETIASGDLYIYEKDLRTDIRYNSHYLPAAFKNVLFEGSVSTSGVIKFKVPRGFRGPYAFAAAFTLTSNGRFADQSLPVDISNQFIIE